MLASLRAPQLDGLQFRWVGDENLKEMNMPYSSPRLNVWAPQIVEPQTNLIGMDCGFTQSRSSE